MFFDLVNKQYFKKSDSNSELEKFSRLNFEQYINGEVTVLENNKMFFYIEKFPT